MPNQKGTTLYTLQKKFQNAFGFTLPLFHGRGLLNCAFNGLTVKEVPCTEAIDTADNLGLMPYRKRIVAVST